MRLIVIGRNPQEANIVLNSQYISNYHAEIIQLDNGDMYLVDKSTNGTFLNGIRLTPGKEVAIKRGDSIFIADTKLDWSLIEDVKVPSNVRQIIGIGSHYMNSINVQGPNVSRFHATVRQMSDGKWYICDHSKNGTTVNGIRIQKDRYVRIKKSDEIACAGVPIQNPIPIPDFPWKWIAAAAAVAICVCAVFLIPWKWTPEKISKTYSPTVAWLRTSYHFEVSCSGLDLDALGVPTKFCLDMSADKIDDLFVTYRGNNPMQSQATGFFIGDKGHVVTNRHVAKPWEALAGNMSNGKAVILEVAENVYRDMVTNYIRTNYPRYLTQFLVHIPKLEVNGVLDGTIIIPNGSYPDTQNAVNCHEVVCGTVEEDLAIFMVRQNMVGSIAYVPVEKMNCKELDLGITVYTIGFPFGFSIQKETDILQANYSSGNISRTNDVHKIGFTAPSHHGASGSPVFNERGQLVGVLNSGNESVQGFNYAIKVKYLYDLMKKANIIK